MEKYKLKPINLPNCKHIPEKKSGSHWCKYECEFCKNYEETTDYNGRTDYIEFDCNFTNC